MKALINKDFSYTQYTIGCKINLFLHIGGVLPNGYHEVETLLYPIPKPFDTMSIQNIGTEGISITCTTASLEQGNILHTAYELVKEHCVQQKITFPFGYNIVLEKGIPTGGGLGGGSANAGCFLRHIQKEHGEIYFPDSVLYAMACKLGADVPFFLYNMPMYAYGRGDILQEVPFSIKGMAIVLLTFPHSIDTTWAFQEIDFFREKNKKCLTSFSKYSKKYAGLVLFRNDFEAVLFSYYSEMRICKELLLKYGACFASVSGSGSSMFALFRDATKVSEAVQSIQSMVKGVYSYYL